jgi:hypothetical protein
MVEIENTIIDDSGQTVSLGPLPNPDVFVILVQNALAGHPEIHGKNQDDADFRETLPYHFGQVSGSAQTAVDLKLLPAVRSWDGATTGVLLGIWRAPADSSTFTLNSWVSTANSTNAGFTGLSLTLYDITETPGMDDLYASGNSSVDGFYLGDPSGDFFYVTPHAAYPYIQEFYQNAGPNVYYRNNAIQINSITGDEDFLYNALYIDNTNVGGNFYPLIYNNNPASANTLEFYGGSYHPPATPSGFNLYFTVGENVDTESLSGKIEVEVRLPLEQGFAGFVLSNITEPGEYGVNYNYLTGYDTTIIVQPEESDAQLGSVQATLAPNAINFRADQNLGFTGSISNLSLRDATPSFTGGGADSWTFNGFDASESNDIYWDESTRSLVFEDVDLENATQGRFAGISATQYVGDLNAGNKYILSYDYHDVTGQVKFYYFNSEGKGFRLWEGGMGSSAAYSGNRQRTVTVGSYNDYDTTYNLAMAPRNALSIVYHDHSTQTTSNSGFGARIDNITLRRVADYDPKTLSYSEDVKGWVSFKSFIPESGVSLGGDYYTFYDARLFKHHVREHQANYFYFRTGPSHIDLIFNDSSSVVKDFKTISYEGSASKRLQYGNHQGGATDINYNNLSDRDGWFVDNIETDLQKGSVPEFIKKEGKYYNYIRGGNQTNIQTNVNNSDDIGSLNVQGLGIITGIEYDEIEVDD